MMDTAAENHSEADLLLLKDLLIRTYSSHAVFARRVNVYTQRLRIVSFAGFLVPATVGSLILADKQWATSLLVTVGSIFLVVQFAFSLWAVFAKWDDKLSRALSLQIQQLRIFKEAENIKALSKSLSPEELRARINMCRDLESGLAQEEHSQEVSDYEKVYGFRSALYHLRSECPICKKIPSDSPRRMKGECKACSFFPLFF